MRKFQLLLRSAAFFGVATVAHAQAPWPTKPIRFIVPNTPGGVMDTFARSLSQHLQDRLGQPVFVENRPGASQVIGMDLAAKATPDGTTLVYGTQSNLVFLTASRKRLPYIRVDRRRKRAASGEGIVPHAHGLGYRPYSLQRRTGCMVKSVRGSRLPTR